MRRYLHHFSICRIVRIIRRHHFSFRGHTTSLPSALTRQRPPCQLMATRVSMLALRGWLISLNHNIKSINVARRREHFPTLVYCQLLAIDKWCRAVFVYLLDQGLDGVQTFDTTWRSCLRLSFTSKATVHVLCTRRWHPLKFFSANVWKD